MGVNTFWNKTGNQRQIYKGQNQTVPEDMQEGGVGRDEALPGGQEPEPAGQDMVLVGPPLEPPSLSLSGPPHLQQTTMLSYCR